MYLELTHERNGRIVLFNRYAAFTISIPPCADPKWEKYYLLSFTMSILWIMGISYFMIDWTAMIGCIFNIEQVRFPPQGPSAAPTRP